MAIQFGQRHMVGTGGDIANSVQQTSEGGYIIAGETDNLPPWHGDVYLIKTDLNGDTLWTKTYGDTSYESAYSVQQTVDDGYAVAGFKRISGHPDLDVYFIKTDSQGNSGCTENETMTYVNSTTTQMTNPATGPYPIIIASFSTSINVKSGVSDSVFCFSFDDIVKPPNLQSSFSLSPNPATTHFTISTDQIIADGKIEIFNSLGQKVSEQKIFNSATADIQLPNLSSGIYFLKLTDGEKFYSQKLVIQNQ